jgi:hypothetical protein
MPLLRRAHDRHRGIRTLETAARTAGHDSSKPGDRPMTPRSAAGTQPPATNSRAPMAFIDAEGNAHGRPPCRQYLAQAQRGGRPHQSRRFPISVAPSPTSAENRNPHSHRLWPAGSFLGDFRTPAGARNSSRNQNGFFAGHTGRSGRAGELKGFAGDAAQLTSPCFCSAGDPDCHKHYQA